MAAIPQRIEAIASTGPGHKINTIPDRFTFTIDRRIIPEERLSAVRQEIRDAVKRARQRDRKLKVDLDFIMHVEPGMSDTTHPIFNIARQAVYQVRQKRPLLRMSGGFNDMRFLTNELGVPTIGYGAAGTNAHGDNESIAIKELLQTTEIYAHIAMRMRGIH